MALHPIIINHTISALNTEESIVLPQNVHDMAIRVRNTAHTVKLAVTAGASNTTYVTLDASFPSISLEDLQLYKQTLYIQSPQFATLELFIWVK